MSCSEINGVFAIDRGHQTLGDHARTLCRYAKDQTTLSRLALMRPTLPSDLQNRKVIFVRAFLFLRIRQNL